MAHFRGQLQGRRGSTSRLGDKRKGIHATLSGWNFGLYVELSHEEKSGSAAGRDVVRIYQTKGSNGGGEKALVLTLSEGGAVQCQDSGDVQDRKL
jgi:hypothetical protein